MYSILVSQVPYIVIIKFTSMEHVILSSPHFVMHTHACTHVHTDTDRQTDTHTHLNTQGQWGWQVLIVTKNIGKRAEHRLRHKRNTITIGKINTTVHTYIQCEHQLLHLDSTMACSTFSSCGCFSFTRWVGPFFSISRIAARSFFGNLSNVGTFLKNTNNDTS